MLLNDLSGRGSVVVDADFVVVGAGTVGLLTAARLAERTGNKVICLESGGGHQEGETHPLNEVVHGATTYRGAEKGRFRCLGGTSTRWGGALIPFQESDLKNAAWPITVEDLTPYIAELESIFGLNTGPYSDPNFPFDLGSEHINRLAKWPPFKNRNVANLFDKPLHDSENLSVWLNSHVVEIRNIDNGVLVSARSDNGDSIEIRAQKVIIAAGAIETTRLALLIDKNHNFPISSQTSSLGRFFTDHISVDVGEIENPNRKILNNILGFRFETNGVMRNIRFELSQNAGARGILPPSFTHIGFSSEKRGGFDVLRELFQFFQRRSLPPLRLGFELLANVPWLLKALWWRFIKNRLLFPQDAKLIVHVVIEQESVPENFIRLSNEYFDKFNQPLAEIFWSVTNKDKNNIINTAKLFRETWNSSDLARYGKLRLLDADHVWKNLDDSGGIYHPTGSTRMASHAEDGVVDRDLNIFGFDNIQLLSTSVLRTGGGANPTMMLLLLALRCVDQHCN